MRQATTPTHYFTFPVDPQTLQKILVTYAQGGTIILNKTQDDFTWVEDTYTGYITLTQEETNQFSTATNTCQQITPIEIQVRAVTEDGSVVATDKWRVPIYGVLNNEVL